MLFTVFNNSSSAAPPDSTVSEDAEIEPRTVAPSALAVSCSNHLARSHPQSAKSHPQDKHPEKDDRYRPHVNNIVIHVEGLTDT